MRKKIKRGMALLMAGAMMLTNINVGNLLVRADVEPMLTEADFSLYVNGQVADIYMDTGNELQPVMRAVGDLQEDIQMVTGKLPKIQNNENSVSKNTIIIGTLGESEVIDTLVAAGKLDVSGIQNQWEAFTMQIIENPSEGIDSALVIAGSDKRGTIFGIYDLSEEMGISPWYWWADVPVEQKDAIVFDDTDIEKTEMPDVKYRGIFLNDEENFTVWSEKYMNDTNSPGTPNTITYEKVFELMLRLKANTLWPGMHEQSDAFNKYINPETGSSYCAEAADTYGIVMSSSHCEMLLANNATEWVPWCEANEGKYNLTKINNDWKASYDYTVNSEAMNAYWEDRVAQNYRFENIYMLGLRAVHDAGILHSGLGTNPTYEQKAAVVKSAVEAQLEILSKYEKKYEEETGEKIVFAKAFCPYKEAAEYYKYDLSLPEETMIIWADDNYGYVRQFPTENELNKYAGSGVYYHVSYWGWPCSYLWMATTPLSLMYEEMHKSYNAGSDTYWILNVGDLKPSEIPMEFFLQMAWDVDFVKQDTIKEYVVEVFGRDFSISKETGDEIADILTEVYQICNAKKPEFQGLEQGSEYSLIAYGDEGQKVVNRMNVLLAKSQSIYDSLPQNEQDAYYQMVHYMVKSVKLTLEKNIYAQKSQLYASQGRFLSVNAYADAAYRAHESVLDEIDYYNLKMSDGKWNGILDPYQNVNGLPKIDDAPDVQRVNSSMAKEGIGAVCEGQSTGMETGTLEFYSLADEKRFLDIFTTGYESSEYQIIADAGIYLVDSDGAKLQADVVDGKNIYKGTVDLEKRFWMAVDWSKLATGTSNVELTVRGSNGFTKTFVAKCVKTGVNPEMEVKKGYYEANGIVSMEAEHYSNSVAVNGQEWKVFSDLGNSKDSMKVYPDTSYENKCLFSNDTLVSEAMKTAPYLEYNIYFETSGTYTGSFYRLPTLNEGKYDDGTGKSCRVLVGLDDGVATLLRCNSVVGEYGGSLWSYGVQGNQDIFTFTVNVDTPGWHTLRVLKADAGITFDKIVLTHNSAIAVTSKLGAPESYQTICETAEQPLADLPMLEKDTITVEYGEAETHKLYDFTSDATKAQGGYTAVTPDISMDNYGWTSESKENVIGAYRADATKCSDRDKGFVYGSEKATFYVKGLTPGMYSIGLAVGDRGNAGMNVDNMSVTVNGKEVLKNIDLAAGKTMEYAAKAEVAENGEMSIEFSGDLWTVTSLELWPYEETRNDDSQGAFIADYNGYINIEAEAALENSDFAKVVKVQDTSGMSWFKTNGFSGNGLYFGPCGSSAYTNTNYSANLAPKAEYQVKLNETGSYNVWILLKTQSQEDDSIFVSVDEGTATQINDIISTEGEYVWRKMATVSINEAGIHKFSIIGREDGMCFDKIAISKNSATPTGLGGRMIREGASIDTTELVDLIEKANQKLQTEDNTELKTLVSKAEALLSNNPTQSELDEMSDAIMAAMSKQIVETKDYEALKKALDNLENHVTDKEVLKESLEIINANMELLKVILNQSEVSDKVALYEFEENWNNTLNKNQSAAPGKLGNGENPTLVTDEEKGNVLSVVAKDVNNTSYVSVENPFKSSALDNGATISIWVKSSVLDNYGFLWSAKTKYNYFWLTEAPYLGYDGSNGYIDLNCPHNLPGDNDKQGYLKNNQWNLVTTTITDENVVVYVNGSLVLETRDKNYVAGQNVEHLTRIITLLQSAENIEIGGNNRHWGSAEFLADEFALYKKALTEQEVLKEYLGTITESELMSLIEEAENLLGEQTPPAVDEETESSTDVVTDDENVTMDGTESTEDSVRDENSGNIENVPETGDHADYLKYWFGVVGIGMLFIVMRKKKYQNVQK